MKMNLSTGVFLLALITTASVYGYQMGYDEQYRAVNIQASREVGSNLPVYAQFKVIQSLYLDEAARVSRIEVPLLVPDDMGLMNVFLRQKEREIARWQLSYQFFNNEPGVKEAVFNLEKETWLSGELEIEFDGAAISHPDKAIAPGLFVEPQDFAYPQGNYRIANNAKEGDVSLTIYAERSRWEAVKRRWAGQPTELGIWVGTRLLLFLVLAALPEIILRRVGNAVDTRRGTNGQNV